MIDAIIEAGEIGNRTLKTMISYMNKENKLPLVPFFDRLFVKRDETIERTASGVVLPDSDKEKPSRGVVVIVGPDCKFAFAGQRIIWGQHYGFELMVGGEELTVLREQDIYAGEPKQFNYDAFHKQMDEDARHRNKLRDEEHEMIGAALTKH